VKYNVEAMIEELETENKMLRARNERLEKENTALIGDRDKFKDTLERILAVSKLALWKNDKDPETVAHDDKASY